MARLISPTRLRSLLLALMLGMGACGGGGRATDAGPGDSAGDARPPDGGGGRDASVSDGGVSDRALDADDGAGSDPDGNLTTDEGAGDAATDVGTDTSMTPDAPFVPGETMPYYQVTADFTGRKNVGNLRGVALRPYPGSVDGGTLRLEAGTYENYDFGNTLLDIRGDVVMNNCRGVITDNVDTTIGEHLRILNGTVRSVELNDCEFHNRSQRILDGLKGRNFVVRRSVFTGYVDGIDNASTGGAPVVSGGEIHDSWVGDHAWWYSATPGVVHPSDTQTHNDGSQVTAALGIRFENTFFGAWASEYVGTGTPGSGSESNPFEAPYITDQSTMEAQRSAFLDRFTRADQSWDGTPKRLSTGGSWAAVMGNAAGGTVEHCWFSGGTVSINLTDTSLPIATGWSIRRSVFWNDMSGGRPLDSTTKGVAIYVLGDRSYDIPTEGDDANHWFDGTVVIPVPR